MRCVRAVVMAAPLRRRADNNCPPPAVSIVASHPFSLCVCRGGLACCNTHIDKYRPFVLQLINKL